MINILCSRLTIYGTQIVWWSCSPGRQVKHEITLHNRYKEGTKKPHNWLPVAQQLQLRNHDLEHPGSNLANLDWGRFVHST